MPCIDFLKKKKKKKQRLIRVVVNEPQLHVNIWIPPWFPRRDPRTKLQEQWLGLWSKGGERREREQREQRKTKKTNFRMMHKLNWKVGHLHTWCWASWGGGIIRL